MPATTGGTPSSGAKGRSNYTRKPKKSKPRTYTLPDYGSEKNQSPPSAPKTGSNPTGSGSAPVTRVPAPKRAQQVKNAAKTRKRVRRANRRIRREARQERRERRLLHQIEAGQSFARLPKPGRPSDVGFERDVDTLKTRAQREVEKQPNPPKPKRQTRPSSSPFPGLSQQARGKKVHIPAPSTPKLDREDKAFMKTARPAARVGYAAERSRDPRVKRAAARRRDEVDRGPNADAIAREKSEIERFEREAANIRQDSAKAARLRAAADRARDRIDELRGDTDTKILGFNVEAELEGRGLVGKVAEKLKRNVATNAQTAGVGQAGEALGKDIVDFGAQAIPSVYGVAAGVKEASEGDWGRLEEQGKAIKEGDPIALLAQGRVDDALKAFEEHPGLSLATLYGGTAALSRGAGGALRAGVAGGAGKRYASRARPDKQGPGGLAKPQQYSKGLVRGRAQRAQERREAKKAERLHREADEAEQRGDPNAAELRVKAKRAEPFRMTEKEVNQAVDQIYAIEYPISRRNRDERLQEVDDLFRGLNPDEQVASVLLAQNIVRPTRASIQGYIDHLKSIDSSRGTYRTKLRRQIIRRLEQLLKNDRDLSSLDDIAREYARRTEPLQDKLVDIGVLDAVSRRGAKLAPTLTREIGATFDKTPQKTEATKRWERLREEESAVIREVRQLERRHYAAREREKFAEGKATVQAQQGRRQVRKEQGGEIFYHGTDNATAARLEREGGFQNARRDVVWAGTRETAEGYVNETPRLGKTGAGRVIALKVTPGTKLLRTDSDEYVNLAMGKDNTADIYAAVADAGYHGMRMNDGSVRVFDKSRVKVVPRSRRTDLTERQGGRLLDEQSRRAELERKLLDARERLQKARFERRKAKPPRDARVSREWRDADGEVVSLDAAEQFLRENPDTPNPEEIALISQAPGLAGQRKAFYIPGGSGGPRGLNSKRRTGEAVEHGEFAADVEAARSTAAFAQGIIDNFESYARQVAALEDPRARSHKKSTADNIARDLEIETGYRWRVVPTKPMFGRQAHADELIRRADELAMREAVQTSLSGRAGDAPGVQWTAIPEVAAKRLTEHLSSLPQGTFGRALRGYNRLFRGVVLTTSPAWMLGNVTEATLRTALNRAGPADLKFMHDVLAELERIDPGRAAEFDAMIGRGQFGMSELNATRTVLEHYSGSALEPLAKAFDALRHTPGPRQVANAWVRYTDTVFKANGAV